MYKKIPIYQNYEISREGLVRNCKSGKILKTPKKGRYLTVALSINGEYKHHNVHRLVAMSWLGLPENYEHLQVAHCDGNSLNNDFSNLKWATPKENTHDKYAHESFNCKNGENHHNARLTKQLVCELRRAIASGGVDCADLSKIYGIPKVTIYDAVTGKSWKSVDSIVKPVSLVGRQCKSKWSNYA